MKSIIKSRARNNAKHKKFFIKLSWVVIWNLKEGKIIGEAEKSVIVTCV